MKVLVLHSELGVLRGGGENFTKNLFTAFAMRGHHVAAAFVADRRKKYPISVPSCIEPIPIPGWWSRNLGQELLASVHGYMPFRDHLQAKWDHLQEAISWRTARWHSRRFESCIRQLFANRWNDFDAVYVHSDTILAGKVAKYRPTVLRLPGPVTADLKSMLLQVPAVCANGDALVRIRDFLGDHAIELPIGIDTEVFKPGPSAVRSALGWTSEHRVIGYVGRLTHLKGVDLLAAAFREIFRKAVDTRLLIVGSGAEEKNLRPLLKKELSQGIVHIEPDVNHEKLPNWYRAMDLLVMPSRYENLSNAIIEATACGIPFLASNIGGNRLLARTGAGWLFEPESVSSLILCLGSVLENSSELKTRGEIGYRHVADCHSWANSAKRLEEIFMLRLDVRS